MFINQMIKSFNLNNYHIISSTKKTYKIWKHSKNHVKIQEGM